jgi:hypothetical protein
MPKIEDGNFLAQIIGVTFMLYGFLASLRVRDGRSTFAVSI